MHHTFSRIYTSNLELYETYKDYDKVYYSMPRCLLSVNEKIKSRSLIRDYCDFSLANKFVLDYTFNVFNIYTAYYLFQLGASKITISPELSENEILELSSRFEKVFGFRPNLEIIVGDEFLSAHDLMLRNSDGHTICDLTTHRPLNNPNFGIHIGNHVWCGYRTSILKDASIPDNCVVAACAVVGKREFSPNSIIGGIPAKTIKTNIEWHSVNVDRFIQMNPELIEN